VTARGAGHPGTGPRPGRGRGLAAGGAALFLAGAAAGGVAVAERSAPTAASSIHGCVNVKTRALTVPQGREFLPARDDRADLARARTKRAAGQGGTGRGSWLGQHRRRAQLHFFNHCGAENSMSAVIRLAAASIGP
jgi:hypothetical protein